MFKTIQLYWYKWLLYSLALTGTSNLIFDLKIIYQANKTMNKLIRKMTQID